MTKFTKEDFTEFEDGDYTAANHPHWICIRGTRPGDYYARVSSSDWRDEYAGRGSTVDSESGFASIDEALQWGVDCVNEMPLRIACSSLEIAFAELGEWMPFIVAFADAARAEGAAAEREACALIAEKDANAYRAASDGIRPAEGFEYHYSQGRLYAASRIERAIRARSNGGAT